MYRTLIMCGSGSGKSNKLLNLMKHHQPDVDKIYFFVKDLFESKYQLLINKREKGRIKRTKKPETFIDYHKTIDDVYENLEEYNPTK